MNIPEQATKAIGPITDYHNRKQEAEDLLNQIKRKAKGELTAWSHHASYRGIPNLEEAGRTRDEALALSDSISADIDKLRGIARRLRNPWLVKNLKTLEGDLERESTGEFGSKVEIDKRIGFAIELLYLNITAISLPVRSKITLLWQRTKTFMVKYRMVRRRSG